MTLYVELLSLLQYFTFSMCSNYMCECVVVKKVAQYFGVFLQFDPNKVWKAV
jgi:hypothetical protein